MSRLARSLDQTKDYGARVISRIKLAPELGDDLDRILNHHIEHEAADAKSRIEDILRAIDVLKRNLLVGRRIRADLGELVIGRCARGDVALYRYVTEIDTLFVLVLRSRKESGYTRTQA